MITTLQSLEIRSTLTQDMGSDESIVFESLSPKQCGNLTLLSIMCLCYVADSYELKCVHETREAKEIYKAQKVTKSTRPLPTQGQNLWGEESVLWSCL